MRRAVVLFGEVMTRLKPGTRSLSDAKRRSFSGI